MALEIERKFLVNMERFHVPAEGLIIKQAFLNSDMYRVVRIRIMGDIAFLTIKGITKGMKRDEYEYEIPVADAETLIDNICEKPAIEKIRYKVEYRDHCWEVDVFSGENSGLVIAEIELQSEDEAFEIPEWLGEEVTGDERYYNSNLVRKPFNKW